MLVRMYMADLGEYKTTHGVFKKDRRGLDGGLTSSWRWAGTVHRCHSVSCNVLHASCAGGRMVQIYLLCSESPTDLPA